MATLQGEASSWAEEPEHVPVKENKNKTEAEAVSKCVPPTRVKVEPTYFEDKEEETVGLEEDNLEPEVVEEDEEDCKEEEEEEELCAEPPEFIPVKVEVAEEYLSEGDSDAEYDAVLEKQECGREKEGHAYPPGLQGVLSNISTLFGHEKVFPDVSSSELNTTPNSNVFVQDLKMALSVGGTSQEHADKNAVTNNKLRKSPKTGAERVREYRLRKKALKAAIFQLNQSSSGFSASGALSNNVCALNLSSKPDTVDGSFTQPGLSSVNHPIVDQFNLYSSTLSLLNNAGSFPDYSNPNKEQAQDWEVKHSENTRKRPKTGAERVREYRLRKKALKATLLQQNQSTSESSTSGLLNKDVCSSKHELSPQPSSEDQFFNYLGQFNVRNSIVDQFHESEGTIPVLNTVGSCHSNHHVYSSEEQAEDDQIKLCEDTTKRRPKTSAERMREYRARKYGIKIKASPKTPAERMREYRLRKKALDELLSRQNNQRMCFTE